MNTNNAGINQSSGTYNEYFINLRDVQPLDSINREEGGAYDSLRSITTDRQKKDNISAYIKKAQ
jgi:hypothetical protein